MTWDPFRRPVRYEHHRDVLAALKPPAPPAGQVQARETEIKGGDTKIPGWVSKALRALSTTESVGAWIYESIDPFNVLPGQTDTRPFKERVKSTAALPFNLLSLAAPVQGINKAAEAAGLPRLPGAQLLEEPGIALRAGIDYTRHGPEGMAGPDTALGSRYPYQPVRKYYEWQEEPGDEGLKIATAILFDPLTFASGGTTAVPKLGGKVAKTAGGRLLREAAVEGAEKKLTREALEAVTEREALEGAQQATRRSDAANILRRAGSITLKTGRVIGEGVGPKAAVPFAVGAGVGTEIAQGVTSALGVDDNPWVMLVAGLTGQIVGGGTGSAIGTPVVARITTRQALVPQDQFVRDLYRIQQDLESGKISREQADERLARLFTKYNAQPRTMDEVSEAVALLSEQWRLQDLSPSERRNDLFASLTGQKPLPRPREIAEFGGQQIANRLRKIEEDVKSGRVKPSQAITWVARLLSGFNSPIKDAEVFIREFSEWTARWKAQGLSPDEIHRRLYWWVTEGRPAEPRRYQDQADRAAALEAAQRRIAALNAEARRGNISESEYLAERRRILDEHGIEESELSARPRTAAAAQEPEAQPAAAAEPRPATEEPAPEKPQPPLEKARAELRSIRGQVIRGIISPEEGAARMDAVAERYGLPADEVALEKELLPSAQADYETTRTAARRLAVYQREVAAGRMEPDEARARIETEGKAAGLPDQVIARLKADVPPGPIEREYQYREPHATQRRELEQQRSEIQARMEQVRADFVTKLRPLLNEEDRLRARLSNPRLDKRTRNAARRRLDAIYAQIDELLNQRDEAISRLEDELDMLEAPRVTEDIEFDSFGEMTVQAYDAVRMRQSEIAEAITRDVDRLVNEQLSDLDDAAFARARAEILELYFDALRSWQNGATEEIEYPRLVVHPDGSVDIAESQFVPPPRLSAETRINQPPAGATAEVMPVTGRETFKGDSGKDVTIAMPLVGEGRTGWTAPQRQTVHLLDEEGTTALITSDPLHEALSAVAALVSANQRPTVVVLPNYHYSGTRQARAGQASDAQPYIAETLRRQGFAADIFDGVADYQAKPIDELEPFFTDQRQEIQDALAGKTGRDASAALRETVDPAELDTVFAERAVEAIRAAAASTDQPLVVVVELAGPYSGLPNATYTLGFYQKERVYDRAHLILNALRASDLGPPDRPITVVFTPRMPDFVSPGAAGKSQLDLATETGVRGKPEPSTFDAAAAESRVGIAPFAEESLDKKRLTRKGGDEWTLADTLVAPGKLGSGSDYMARERGRVASELSDDVDEAVDDLTGQAPVQGGRARDIDAEAIRAKIVEGTPLPQRTTEQEAPREAPRDEEVRMRKGGQPQEPETLDQLPLRDATYAVVGSRDFPNTELVKQLVALLPEKAHVVSGNARGVDKTAQSAARKRGLQVTVYPANWAKLGKKAGMLRNQTVVDNSEVVIAFWDGVSPGTKDAIDKALAAGKEVWIVGPDGRVKRADQPKPAEEQPTATAAPQQPEPPSAPPQPQPAPQATAATVVPMHFSYLRPPGVLRPTEEGKQLRTTANAIINGKRTSTVRRPGAFINAKPGERIRFQDPDTKQWHDAVVEDVQVFTVDDFRQGRIPWADMEQTELWTAQSLKAYVGTGLTAGMPGNKPIAQYVRYRYEGPAPARQPAPKTAPAKAPEQQGPAQPASPADALDAGSFPENFPWREVYAETKDADVFNVGLSAHTDLKHVLDSLVKRTDSVTYRPAPTDAAARQDELNNAVQFFYTMPPAARDLVAAVFSGKPHAAIKTYLAVRKDPASQPVRLTQDGAVDPSVLRVRDATKNPDDFPGLFAGIADFFKVPRDPQNTRTTPDIDRSAGSAHLALSSWTRLTEADQKKLAEALGTVWTDDELGGVLALAAMYKRGISLHEAAEFLNKFATDSSARTSQKRIDIGSGAKTKAGRELAYEASAELKLPRFKFNSIKDAYEALKLPDTDPRAPTANRRLLLYLVTHRMAQHPDLVVQLMSEGRLDNLRVFGGPFPPNEITAIYKAAIRAATRMNESGTYRYPDPYQRFDPSTHKPLDMPDLEAIRGPEPTPAAPETAPEQAQPAEPKQAPEPGSYEAWLEQFNVTSIDEAREVSAEARVLRAMAEESPEPPERPLAMPHKAQLAPMLTISATGNNITAVRSQEALSVRTMRENVPYMSPNSPEGVELEFIGDTGKWVPTPQTAERITPRGIRTDALPLMPKEKGAPPQANLPRATVEMLRARGSYTVRQGNTARTYRPAYIVVGNDALYSVHDNVSELAFAALADISDAVAKIAPFSAHSLEDMLIAAWAITRPSSEAAKGRQYAVDTIHDLKHRLAAADPSEAMMAALHLAALRDGVLQKTGVAVTPKAKKAGIVKRLADIDRRKAAAQRVQRAQLAALSESIRGWLNQAKAQADEAISNAAREADEKLEETLATISVTEADLRQPPPDAGPQASGTEPLPPEPPKAPAPAPEGPEPERTRPEPAAEQQAPPEPQAPAEPAQQPAPATAQQQAISAPDTRTEPPPEPAAQPKEPEPAPAREAETTEAEEPQAGSTFSIGIKASRDPESPDFGDPRLSPLSARLLVSDASLDGRGRSTDIRTLVDLVAGDRMHSRVTGMKADRPYSWRNLSATPKGPNALKGKELVGFVSRAYALYFHQHPEAWADFKANVKGRTLVDHDGKPGLYTKALQLLLDSGWEPNPALATTPAGPAVWNGKFHSTPRRSGPRFTLEDAVAYLRGEIDITELIARSTTDEPQPRMPKQQAAAEPQAKPQPEQATQEARPTPNLVRRAKEAARRKERPAAEPPEREAGAATPEPEPVPVTAGPAEPPAPEPPPPSGSPTRTQPREEPPTEPPAPERNPVLDEAVAAPELEEFRPEPPPRFDPSAKENDGDYYDVVEGELVSVEDIPSREPERAEAPASRSAELAAADETRLLPAPSAGLPAVLRKTPATRKQQPAADTPDVAVTPSPYERPALPAPRDESGPPPADQAPPPVVEGAVVQPQRPRRNVLLRVDWNMVQRRKTKAQGIAAALRRGFLKTGQVLASKRLVNRQFDAYHDFLSIYRENGNIATSQVERQLGDIEEKLSKLDTQNLDELLEDATRAFEPEVQEAKAAILNALLDWRHTRREHLREANALLQKVAPEHASTRNLEPKWLSELDAGLLPIVLRDIDGNVRVIARSQMKNIKPGEEILDGFEAARHMLEEAAATTRWAIMMRSAAEYAAATRQPLVRARLGKMEVLVPRAVAKDLAASTKEGAWIEWYRQSPWAAVESIASTVSLTGDLSALLNQAYVVAIRNPGLAVQLLGAGLLEIVGHRKPMRAIQARTFEKLSAEMKRRGFDDQDTEAFWVSLGLAHTGVAESMATADKTSVYAVPVVGRFFGNANQAFNDILLVARAAMAQDAIRLNKNIRDNDAWMAAINAHLQTVNDLTGTTNVRTTGLETAFFVAGRLVRSQIMSPALMFVPGKRGAIARRAVGAQFVLTAAVTYAANELRGEETNLFDPTAPNWMTIRNVFGNDISLLPWAPFVSAVARSVEQRSPDPLVSWAIWKARPIMRTAGFGIAGQDTMGDKFPRPTEQAFYGKLAENYVPLSFRALYEDRPGREGADMAGRLSEFAFSFLGARVSPMTISEQLRELRDDYAAEMFGEKWTDLTAEQRRQINNKPDVKRLLIERDKAETKKADALRAESARRSLEFRERMETIDRWYKAGRDDKGRRFTARDAKEAIDNAYRQLIYVNRNSDPELTGYFNLREIATGPDGRVDYELLEALREEYLAAHPKVAEYLEETEGQYDSDALAAYRRARQQAREYYNIPPYPGLTTSQGVIAQRTIQLANAVIRTGAAKKRKDAYAMLIAAGAISPEEAQLALYADKVKPNPARKQFIQQNKEFREWYIGDVLGAPPLPPDDEDEKKQKKPRPRNYVAAGPGRVNWRINVSSR